MATSGSAQVLVEAFSSRVSTAPVTNLAPRHSALVRVTHWITTLCFFALLVSGIEIVISHPRFYWGETGTVLTTPLFQLPIPSSRRLVPTGYGYVLPDQNGWSRAQHFEAAWIAVLVRHQSSSEQLLGLHRNRPAALRRGIRVMGGEASERLENVLPSEAKSSLTPEVPRVAGL
jgi:hypothetical protein